MTQSFNQYSENETKIWHKNILNQFFVLSSFSFRNLSIGNQETKQMKSLPANVSDNLNGRQSVVNVIAKLYFLKIYWEIILSIYNKVCSFLLTMIELLGSLRFKLLNSNFSSSEVQRVNQTLKEQRKQCAKII